MKSRNREINVFSMSALDLFASALGAFILISVVLMPYYLRVDPEDLQRLRQDLHEAQRENAQMRQALSHAPKVAFPNLDMVVALDTTGSMGEEVAGLREEIGQFAELMMELAPEFGLGVIDFKDRCEGPRAVREFPLRLMSSTGLSNLVAFTRSMSAGNYTECNETQPEAVDMALDAAIASNWRGASETKIIVIITDNPAYPERRAHTLSSARAFAARGTQHKVSTVFKRQERSEADAEVFLRDLADAGTGKFIRSGSSFTITMLLALAGL